MGVSLVSQPLKTQFKITKPYLITSFCILQHKPMILYKKIANLLFRLSRNLQKGQIGDEINVLMAACAWNLRKWLVATTIFLFLQKVRYFFIKNHWFML
jgi:hypothetical protein